MINPGKYLATIKDYGIRTVGENKTPQMQIEFLTKEAQTVYFQNFLTPGTTTSNYFSNLMKTLVETGALKTKSFTDISKGIEGGALDTTVELEIVVTEQLDKDGQPVTNKQGEPYMTVKYINNPNRSGMEGKLAAEEAISVLSGLNLDAAILEAEQATGVEVGSKKPDFSKDDIPF